MRFFKLFAVFGALLLAASAAPAADYPAPRQGEHILKDFRFHTGEVMPQLRIHYTTVGEPSGIPVLLLHGTYGSAQNFLNAEFAGELFGAGQPLDATKYFIIIPDAIGTGKSTKPSDGLKGKFPLYNYDDMVDAQHRLLTEALNIKHLRLVIGNSMGGMQTWVWATKYPDFMDLAVPMASQPSGMAGRNWILRRMLTEAIRRDPEWKNGDYEKQPSMIRYANVFFTFATNGGAQAIYKAAPNREKADALVKARLDAPFTGDANDLLYQWDSSRDYDPWPHLDKIKARVLAINAADDERNPPELGIMEDAMKRVKTGKLFLIPASPDTRGHGTTGAAKFWKVELERLLGIK